MKNYTIYCTILDKLNPDSDEPVQNIDLYTNIEASDENEAVSILESTYNVQEIKHIEEIL